MLRRGHRVPGRQKGDLVLTRSAVGGKTETKPVLAVSKNIAYDLVTIQTGASLNGKTEATITGTPGHPFFTPGGEKVPMDVLRVGQQIVSRDGATVVVQAKTSQHVEEGISVYNLTVEDDHTYFIGNADGGEWVHNTCPPTTLTRFGTEYESPEELAADASKAEANGFPHGVSAIGDATKPGSVANYEDVAKVFKVIKTGKNLSHYTIELPNPVTPEVAETFNGLFGRIP